MKKNNSRPPLALRKNRPKSTLSLVDEVMNRQIGRSTLFKKKLYGSLHMVERLEYSHSLEEHQNCIGTIEFNDRGDLLVSGSEDRNLPVIVWNWATGKKLKSYECDHRSGCRGTGIKQVAWLPFDDSSMIVTCGRDGQVQLLDLINGTRRRLVQHYGDCNGFAIHPDTPHVVISIGEDGKVLSSDVRDSETTKLVTVLEGASSVELYTIHSSPRNGNEFCVGGMSEHVKIYDRRKASVPLFKLRPKNLKRHKNVYVASVTYNHDGTEILAAYNNDEIYLFDIFITHPYGDYAHKYRSHRNRGDLLCANYFGPKSEFIVSSSFFGNIFFWEKNTEALVQCMLDYDDEWVSCVKPHPYDPVLATSGQDHNVKIWVPSADRPPTFSELKERLLSKSRPHGTSYVENHDDDDED